MDLQLKGKRALVVGGSSGIGLAVADALAREGATVAIAARTQETLEAAAASIEKSHGQRVVHATVDTGDWNSVQALKAEIVAAIGGVDILVNSAATRGGGGAGRSIETLTDEAFYDDINVKVMGYARSARAFAPDMAARGWGRVIFVGGHNMRRTGGSVASMRNAAVSALAKNLADELGARGVNVTTVHPSFVRTEQILAMTARRADQEGVPQLVIEKRMANSSIGRMVEPFEVANVVAFLASPLSVAVTGENIFVAGGMAGTITY